MSEGTKGQTLYVLAAHGRPGGTLALVPQEDPDVPRTAVLLYQTPLQSLDYGTFQNRLTDFVDTAEAWIDYLDNFEQRMESDGDHLPETLLGGPMLRV